MENIPGDTLESMWGTLDDSRKSSIALQLKDIFTKLRSLPSPGYFGTLNRRKMEDDLFWSPKPNLAINGPFETEEELINGLLGGITAQDDSDSAKQRAAYYLRVLPLVFRSEEAVSLYSLTPASS